MPMDGRTAEKLRGFLRELPPRARAMLLAELERGGDAVPGSEIIIRELRNAERSFEEAPAPPPAPVAEPVPPPPVAELSDLDSYPARMFFTFLEPFFVDDAPDQVHHGRLARAAAGPIWEWICRDLVPADVKAYGDNVAKLLAAGQATSAFQEKVAQAIEKVLAAIAGDDKARRKLANQIGTPRALDDVRYLATLLKSRDVLAVLAGKIPPKIRNLTDEHVASVIGFLDSTAGRQREVYLMSLVLVLGRLAAPWQLIRLAIKAADSDFPARIAETPYAPAVTIVLAELERLVRRLDANLRRGQVMEQPNLLKDIHDAARGLRTEIDLTVDSAWARALAAIRSQLAASLRPEIESAPGRVRRMLRARAAKDIVPGSTLDASDVAETEALLGFVGQCRSYANEIAINEMTMRAFTEVQNYLETQIDTLLDGLRAAGKAERAYRQSQFDAAVRFCGKIYGVDYAETLKKASEVALASDRKVAAAKQAAAAKA